MKKLSLLFLSAWFFNFLPSLSLQKEKLQSSVGEAIEISYRALEPGEVVLVTLQANPMVKKTTVIFLGEKYNLGSRTMDLEPFAFIGLDLNLKPDSYLMDVSIERIDGKKENIQKEIVISKKEFPARKLWVKEKFVTPPPEVQERIHREAEILKAVYSIRSPQWLGQAEFILPFSGKVSPNFGEKRIYNNVPRSTHSGVDVAAPYGSPIQASNSGKVVLASHLYYSGKTVIIDHGLGLFTFYCHFSKILKKRGELVKKGDIIGRAGATGRATGPHLHWGVKIFESRIDPLSLLSLSLE